MSSLDSYLLDKRRKFVAMAFVNLANTPSAFVDVEDLLVVLLYDDSSCGKSQSSRSPLRLAGYRLSRVPHGVQWGGERNSAFLKNLLLAPKRKAFGQRIDRSKTDLLTLALKLDRRLSRAARHSAAPWPELRLPRMWAGFQHRHVPGLRFGGPEFEDECRLANASAASVVEAAARTVDGLVHYPMDWVSSQLGLAKVVFAEVTPATQQRVFRVTEIPRSLIGFQGASGFDFFSSRYRRESGTDSSRKVAKTYRNRLPSQKNVACARAPERSGPIVAVV